ncbi:GTPase Der OS=Streptomyces glaucescens OX=1907 GN=der PE=3 SV=1 [Streptomyces glaucescens]
MNDHIHPDGSGGEHDHGALGDAEYAQFMELAAEKGFDPGGRGRDRGGRARPAARPRRRRPPQRRQVDPREPHHRPPRGRSSRTSPASPATASRTRPSGAGRRFKVVDTGGWEQDVLGIDASVAAQAEYAIEAADAVVFVVDAKVGATDTDEAVVRLLRKAGKPVVLCANKVDGPAARPTRPTCGPWASASRTRSPRCTAAAPATCWTPS